MKFKAMVALIILSSASAFASGECKVNADVGIDAIETMIPLCEVLTIVNQPGGNPAEADPATSDDSNSGGVEDVCYHGETWCSHLHQNRRNAPKL